MRLAPRPMRWLLVAAAASAAPLALRTRADGQPATPPGPDSVLMMSGANVSVGGNFFDYYAVSHKDVLVRKGDTFEYDLFIPSRSTETNGGADLSWTDGSTPLRDMNIPDQNGQRVHPNTVLPQAKDKWYHRIISLDEAAGKHTAEWDIVFEGDTPGPYTIFVGNMGIHHKDGSWDWAYHGGPVPEGAGVTNNGGYSRELIVRPVDRSWVTSANVNAVIAEQAREFQRQKAFNQYQHDVEYVERVAKNAPDGAAYQPHIQAARGILDKIKADPNMTPAQMEAQIHAGQQQLTHTHSLVKGFTGYLVGHSHIDFQWLWEWPESYEVCRATFNTVANLMDEFPGFSFSQSSSALYKITQQTYPAVFKRIQQKVKAGQWDIVGGRVCEGDTNMVSEESHARQFLLGQRYFRANFGKTARTGWEPDTFGHTWSMPEILKMGGCDYYYFCRGGKGKPLFWWEGPDGTKVLTFDEAASGSWYDGDLGNSTLDEIFPWYDKTGTKDILWVYGVGDHGGGVTREQLRVAQGWMNQPFLPNVKYSTADRFFDKLAKGNLSKVPTISDELNPVFEGCYTTHSDMKRLNRDAENITASAETVATFASQFGLPYPKKTFDDNWEGIVFNHHHDTLPGSAIHESYVKSRQQLSSIVTSSRNIAGDSLRFMATFMKRAPEAGYSVTVFNPLGWTHTAVAEVPWPFPADDQTWVAVSPAGDVVPVSVVHAARPDNATGEPMAVFTAKDVPGFGYRVFGVRPAKAGENFSDHVALSQGGGQPIILENGRLRVAVDARNGLVTSLFDKVNNREALVAGGAGNRLELWHEEPHGMSAWAIGRYTGHVALDGPASVRVIENTPGRALVRIDRDYNASHITQYVALRAGSDQVDLPIWVDWQETGNSRDGGPFLKVACDVAGQNLKASYEIPYATISRPADGKEVVALKSADLSGADYGVTLVNDCKSGHSADGNTLRLSLLRTSYEPDRLADQREHFINTALFPHAGVYGSNQVRRGFEFNQEFLTARVPDQTSATLPLEQSFVSVKGPTVVATVVKRAEDNPDAMVVRFYEANGGPARVSVGAATKIAATRWVNFVEDPLSPVSAGAAASADLHKYEIRNAMLIQPKPVVARPKPSGPLPTPRLKTGPTPLHQRRSGR